MAAPDIYLGLSGSETLLSPFGRKYSRTPVEIARQDRTASGRLVKDIVALKYSFTLAYSLIDTADMLIFEGLYGLQSQLSLRMRRPDGGLTTYAVHMKPFAYERVVSVGNGLWGNVVIELEQV